MVDEGGGEGSERACSPFRSSRGDPERERVEDKEESDQRYRRQGLRDTWGEKKCCIDWITRDM